jgi:hypothetical protein
MRLSAAQIGVILSLLLSSSAHAEYSVRICIGEDGNKCPVQYEAFYGCGTSYDNAAEDVCTITNNGQKEVLRYRMIKQGTHEGGQCGYGWFRVTCLD